MKFLDAETFLAFDRAGDLGVERGAFRQRPEAEHLEVLPAQFRAACFPLLAVADAVQKLLVQADRFLAQERFDHGLAPCPGGLGGFRSLGGEQQDTWQEQEDEGNRLFHNDARGKIWHN